MDRCSVRLGCGCLVDADGKVTYLPPCNGGKDCKANRYLESYMNNLSEVISNNLIKRRKTKK